jgi:hypothetical protein
MEPGDYAPILKKIKVGMLEPGLQHEIAELAAEMGYEATITASSNLHFLFKIYQAEKARAGASAEALKKAEDMILRLSSLHHAIIQREEQRRKTERKRKAPLNLIEGGLLVSKKTRELLLSIGIEDESTVIKAEELFGEKLVGDRVELVLASTLGKEVVKKVFARYPETVLIPKEDDFISELEAMENKKAVLDGWAKSNERPLPVWADYDETPGILIDTYEDITRQLGIPLPKQAPEKIEKERSYQSRPMDPDDFKKVVKALGFQELRETTHGTLMRDGGGNTMCIQKAHRGQMELSAPTLKKKIKESGIDPEEFEGKRRELGL